MAALTEADILERIIAPRVGNLPPETARSLLSLEFDRETKQEIRKLLKRNNKGTISAEERLVLEKFLLTGQFLDLLNAKARLSLDRNVD